MQSVCPVRAFASQGTKKAQQRYFIFFLGECFSYKVAQSEKQ